jgi:hypothetical protein
VKTKTGGGRKTVVELEGESDKAELDGRRGEVRCRLVEDELEEIEVY